MRPTSEMAPTPPTAQDSPAAIERAARRRSRLMFAMVAVVALVIVTLLVVYVARVST